MNLSSHFQKRGRNNINRRLLRKLHGKFKTGFSILKGLINLTNYTYSQHCEFICGARLFKLPKKVDQSFCYIAVFRQPRIQTRQYLDKYCFNQSESRQRRNY